MSNKTVFSNYLLAREIRQQIIDDCLKHQRFNTSVVIFLSSNIPGSNKYRPGIYQLLYRSLELLDISIGISIVKFGNDMLGQYYVLTSAASLVQAKLAAVRIENISLCGRLLDIDIYSSINKQLDRHKLRLKPRVCILCNEFVCVCNINKRHQSCDILYTVDLLLQSYVHHPTLLNVASLARELSLGAFYELHLTPKPGLVDFDNSGAHNDLSYNKMYRSVSLLPFFFADILACYKQHKITREFIYTGIKAETRMMQLINTNAHRGYIFLSGITLMAACRCNGNLRNLRSEIANLSKIFFRYFYSPSSIKKDCQYELSGIRIESEQGLPSVFEYAWPRYREVLAMGWNGKRAALYLMSLLMQCVEDTTAINRCGITGLTRLRNDGYYIQTTLESNEDPEFILSILNNEYCKIRLTMGGVADCMALIFALQKVFI